MDSLPMTCLLPLSFPVNRRDPRVSGPLWVGSLGDQGAMHSMTEQKAMRMCVAEYEDGDIAGWSKRDFEMEKRRVLRSVRNIESEGSVIDAAHHILVDDLSSWLGVGSPPSPTLMVEELRKLGYRASLAHYGKPSFKTDASWDDIVEVSLGHQPPM